MEREISAEIAAIRISGKMNDLSPPVSSMIRTTAEIGP